MWRMLWRVVAALLLILTAVPDAVAPRVAHAGAITLTYSTGDISNDIPDDGHLNTFAPGFFPPGLITRVRTRVRLNHERDDELTLTLRSPDGSTIILSDRNGGHGDNYGSGSPRCSGAFTEFDDAAPSAIHDASAPFVGAFRPDQPLASFIGRPAGGDWRLRIEDHEDDHEGTLYCWQLEVTIDTGGPVTCAPRPPVRITIAALGPGQVQVTVAATGENNTVRALRFQPVANGLIDLPGGPTNSPGDLTYALPVPQQAYAFALRRVSAGATTARFVVSDGCGEWPTFAGFGAGFP